MDITDKSEKIETKQNFIDFLDLLKKDFEYNKKDWENDNLEFFLEGLYGYSIDMRESNPSWKLFAEMLISARSYE
jgi:hypothetical protein